jgi:DNA-binding IclR family transcriptional regulator
MRAGASGSTADDTRQKRVPAVANALALLEALRVAGNEPRSLSELARTTSMNVSTCFNILKTLEDRHVVTFDPSTKTYRLGLYLAELGALVDEQRQSARLAMEEARRISDALDLGCFLMSRNDRDEFVVLDKVESPNPIRVTIDVGAAFPPTGAVAAKAWFAWASDEAVANLVERYGLADFTAHSITDAEAFRHDLETVRRLGYSTSVGEYYPDHNAVGAAVYAWDHEPQLLFVVVGTTGQLSGVELERAGAEVAAAAARATKSIGGRHPGSMPTEEDSMLTEEEA